MWYFGVSCIRDIVFANLRLDKVGALSLSYKANTKLSNNNDKINK